MSETGAAGPSLTAYEGEASLARHALGLAILVLTVAAAHQLARTSIGPAVGTLGPIVAETHHDANGHAEAHTPAVAVAASVPSAPSVPSLTAPRPITPTRPIRRRITRREIEAHIADVAARYALSPRLLAAIVDAESHFNPRAVSRRGARGLMQLMPETASTLRVGNTFDPYENLNGGARHLRQLMDRFRGDLPLVLAAYNAGEQAVIDYGGVPPFPATRRYVMRILRRIGRSDLAAEVARTAAVAVPLGAARGRLPGATRVSTVADAPAAERRVVVDVPAASVAGDAAAPERPSPAAAERPSPPPPSPTPARSEGP